MPLRYLLLSAALIWGAACGSDSATDGSAAETAAPADGAVSSVSSGEAGRVAASDIDAVLGEGGTLFLDVRRPEEIDELGTIKGHLNIPIEELEDRMGEIPRDRPILTS